jgi:serine protease Do
MNRISTFLLLALLPLAGLARADRPPVNDKKAPDNRKDLEAIQSALMQALPKARDATVCVDLGEGSGSGVIVSEDGLVLTAAHVSTAVGKELTIVLEDGTRLKAEALGLVASTDAAMIQILEEGPFPFAEVDRLDSARLGDWVFSLGHSGGFDQDRGSVVRLGRLVRIAGSTFQTDCILIGGDSGGPLFDLAGRVIGIHSRVGQHKLVNMHVPAKEFVTHWDRMLASEFIGEGPFAAKPAKGSGFLGLATESAADRDGLLVTRVGDDSPAAAAGIEVGDIIVKINGQEVNERGEMQAILQEMAAGDKLEIDLLRADEPQTINLRLGAR